MPTSDLSPMMHVVVLRCSPERASATYSERIGEWWDPRYTANPETLESVTIEPWVGGRVYATHRDIGHHDWGEVTVWEPGRRLVHTFTLAQDPEHPSQVTIDVTPDSTGSGCTVHFAHGGWNASNADARPKFGDWPLLLDRFAALANADE